MGKFDGVLLVSDYDETLRPEPLDYVPEGNLKAIEYFVSEGGRFTVCSGRDFQSYERIRGSFKVNTYVVLSNGAIIYDDKKDEIVFENQLNGGVIEDLIEYQKMFPTCNISVQKGKDYFVTQTGNLKNKWYDSGKHINAREIPQPWCAFRITTATHPEYKEEEIQEILSVVGKKYAAYRSRGCVDISGKDITKGSGALRLCDMLGLSRENLYCIGDSWNDIPMLEAAKIGFMPKNAESDLRGRGFTEVCDAKDCALRDVINILDKIY